MKEALIVGVILLIGFLIYKVYTLSEDNKSLQQKHTRVQSLCDAQQKELAYLRNKYSYLEKMEQELSAANQQVAKLEEYKAALVQRMNMYIVSKCEGYHHLAGLMADMQTRHYEKTAKFLKHKKHPAVKKAETVEELRKETKAVIAKNKVLEYKLAYIRSMYSNIDDIFDDAFDSSEFELETEETTDRVRLYLEPEEYNKLSVTERNQLALDKYIQGKKTDWQIGRDYELYIGHLCKEQGYKVEYTGISMKLEDMGRDLIVFDQQSPKTFIVQCKNWSQRAEIHEKHIFQLYGSTVLYKIDNPFFDVKAVFVTTTNLSPKAQEFAEILDIEVIHVKMNEFPRIKCNINKDGERIYHLPFDQQYDKVQIVNEGEKYATTVEEAENAGFRRAYRWHGTHDS